jgi:hypothetical protein
MRKSFFCGATLVSVALTASIVANEGTYPSVSLHGYGEVHFNNIIDGSRMVDPHRAVIGITSNFTEKISWNMEVDFEHSFKEPELEFAFLEVGLTESFSIRAGSLLLPMGALNEFHEPPLFFSVERPFFQKEIIPTSWGEVGAGITLTLFDNSLAIRSYIVNGAAGLKNDSTLNSIRSSRTKSVEPKIIDIASASRIEYSPLSGVDIGVSAYIGGADQSIKENLQMTMGVYEGDVRLRFKGADFQFAGGYTRQSGEWFAAHTINKTTVDAVSGAGALGEFAWHFKDVVKAESDIVPFVRGEFIDTDFGAGTNKSSYTVITGGLSLLPVAQVCVKADVSVFNHAVAAYTLNDGKKDSKIEINLGVGVMF